VLFLGRFHPLLVHLPIGILVLLGFLELLSRRPKHRKAACNSGYLLAVAVPASILSAALGWMLSQGGGYDSALLAWHFGTGIATAILCAVTAVFYRMQALKAYRASLAFTVAALVVASHFGGSLTHGSDYLLRHAPGPIRGLFQQPATQPVSSRQQKPAYSQIIHPVFDTYCVPCHGPEKAKGGLRLDTIEHLLKGGDAGPGIVAGKAAESEIMKRVRLPLDDEDHMPPEGKPQPSPGDLALLEWWINSGASKDAPASDLAQTPEIQKLLGKQQAPPSPKQQQSAGTTLNREQTLALAGKLGVSLGIPIDPLSATGPELLCNAYLAGTNFGNPQLLTLATSRLACAVHTLDLGGAGISDDAMPSLTNFVALKRLHLQNTSVSDRSASSIARLATLENLNLYGTKFTDAGAAELAKLPNLQRVYLWNTEVTPAAARALASAKLSSAERRRIMGEIEALRKTIKDSVITVELGAPVSLGATNSVGTNTVSSAAANAECPISGKPVNPEKTLEYEGKKYAFCCDECLAKAKQDPKAVLAKLLK
jgi:YHS domain-containing protein/uncharacterized membrane protein